MFPLNSFFQIASINLYSSKPVDETEVIKITKGLKISKSSGHDNINTFFLKKIINAIAKPLCHIFNLSISLGKYPNVFKLAKVIPIYKKDNPNLCQNYRPISILPCISKILERIIFNQIYKFLEKYNILCPNQYGFRKNYSTDLAVLDLLDKITQTLANKCHIIGIFMDLSKAFDTLDHKILLKKLERYGIRGTPLAWFKDYLSHRKQYVEFHCTRSQILDLQCGVPQGSILGPLLFLIYINDIIYASNNPSYVLFADDTTLLFAHKEINALIHNINRELPNIANWLKSNKLSLNVNKTNYVVFKSPQTKINDNLCKLNLGNKELERKSHANFLGIKLDEHLKWNIHCNDLIVSISRSIGILNKIKNNLSQNTRLLLYNSLILSKLSYCNIIWGTTSKRNLDKMLLLQKRAIRICSGSTYLAHSNPIFKDLRVLKVADINLLQTALFMYKLNLNIIPDKFQSLFTKNNQIHTHHTRNANKYHLSNPKTSLAHNSIIHKGPDVWNSLPKYITQCTTLISFKFDIVMFAANF